MKSTTLTLLAASIAMTLPLPAQAPEKDKPSTGGEQQAGWLKQMDKNGDGKLAKDETTGLMLQFFDRNDGNKDGLLDKDELDTLAKRLAARGQRPGQQKQKRRRPQGPATEELLKNAPDDVTIVPDISYREGGSKAWKLDLVMPKEKGDKPRPGIVFVHGGGWSSGDKRAGIFLQGAISYAQKGYVCITVNYRLVGEAPFPACIHDVKNAVRWFRANAEKYNLDPDRLGAFGNSAGAHLVCMLGLVKKDAGLEGDGPYQDQSSLVQAVCAAATPTDFLLFGSGTEQRARPGGRFAGMSAKEIEELARKSSPISHVRKDAPPMLLFQGTKDNTVNVKHSDTFVEALKKAGAKDVTYHRIDGAGHGVFNQHKDKSGPAMEKFFARVLGE